MFTVRELASAVADLIWWAGILAPWLTGLILIGLLIAAAAGRWSVLESLACGIGYVNQRLGEAVAWLTLATVLLCFLVAIMRYAFSSGFVWMQELYVWFHALAFMLGAGYALLHDKHVRIDLFYQRMTPRQQAWVNLLGSLCFLFPWLLLLTVKSSGYLMLSWQFLEISPQPGGLPAYFLLKSVIWLFALLLGAQGLAALCQSLLVLSGRQKRFANS